MTRTKNEQLAFELAAKIGAELVGVLDAYDAGGSDEGARFEARIVIDPFGAELEMQRHLPAVKVRRDPLAAQEVARRAAGEAAEATAAARHRAPKSKTLETLQAEVAEQEADPAYRARMRPSDTPPQPTGPLRRGGLLDESHPGMIVTGGSGEPPL